MGYLTSDKIIYILNLIVVNTVVAIFESFRDLMFLF